MNLRLLFFTPEQEQSLEETKVIYSKNDRDSLSLLVYAIGDLLKILETYAFDSQNRSTEDEYLSMFQTLSLLMQPVKKYFSDTGGLSLEGMEVPEAQEETASA